MEALLNDDHLNAVADVITGRSRFLHSALPTFDTRMGPNVFRANTVCRLDASTLDSAVSAGHTQARLQPSAAPSRLSLPGPLQRKCLSSHAVVLLYHA